MGLFKVPTSLGFCNDGTRKHDGTFWWLAYYLAFVLSFINVTLHLESQEMGLSEPWKKNELWKFAQIPNTAFVCWFVCFPFDLSFSEIWRAHKKKLLLVDDFRLARLLISTRSDELRGLGLSKDQPVIITPGSAERGAETVTPSVFVLIVTCSC